MSQQDIKPWVLVSSVTDNTNMQDLEGIAPRISALVDEWQSSGRIMWSGAFDNETTSMAVFEATKDEADDFFQKYQNICGSMLSYHMYQWDAMPILSILS